MEQLLLPAATDRSSSATRAFGPDWTAGAPWTALHPTHRQHWKNRQQARAQNVISIPGGVPEPVQDDSQDAAAAQRAQHQPWQPVWSRLHDMALDRSHRAVVWKTLHGVLPCGALLSFATLRQPVRADTQPLIAQAMCPHCLPLSVPETLTHMLLGCVGAITVWDWICRLWAAYSGAQAPPPIAAVLLADNQSEWRSPQDPQAPSERAASLASALDSRHSGLELSSPRPAPGTWVWGCLRSLDLSPRGQDGQQRLAEGGSQGSSSASQRHLLLFLAPRQASIHEP